MRNVYDTVVNNAGWANIPLGILRIEGRDALPWLHKIVTADIQRLQTGQGTRSALLDAKGHFVADFLLLRDGDALGALVDMPAREALLNALRRYIIREQVTIQDVTDRWMCLSLIGNQAAAMVERTLETRVPTELYDWVWGHQRETAARVVRSARARVPSFDILIPVSGVPDLRAALQELPEISNTLLDTLRIEAGLPRWGVDFDETTLALEIPDVMQIRVDQGCYVGQEVVARIVHRGHVNRHLRGLRLDANALPPRGELIRFDGAEVGAVTSATSSPMLGNIALGYVRRHVEPGAQVQMDHSTARVVELPFPIL
jgi:folate-binding protein YgfZ